MLNLSIIKRLNLRESAKHGPLMDPLCGPGPWAESMDQVSQNMDQVHGPMDRVHGLGPPIFATSKN